MIAPCADEALGRFTVEHEGPFLAGMRTTVRFRYVVGEAGLQARGRIRVGVPNTGWEMPVPPQQRYWDELVSGSERRLAPFHPVNTTAQVVSASGARVMLTVMERMLVPDEDPAFAYWRWWITASVECGGLAAGDSITITYGDRRFGMDGVRVQSFPEPAINVTAYVQAAPEAEFRQLSGSPFYIDVISGAPERANVVRSSVQTAEEAVLKVSVTDAFQCLPNSRDPVKLLVNEAEVQCVPGKARSIKMPVAQAARVVVRERASRKEWGQANPSVPMAEDRLRLYWGDLHAQSEHHVMHSQKKDFRQAGWSKGISCGTLDECYAYGREVACLDYVAITDQGACLTDAWEYCQEKVRTYYCPGNFVTFKGYEAGATVGHRNVIYVTDAVEPPLPRAVFNGFSPQVLYPYYRERGDAILIPHHVKTWTDWSFHDPDLEPVMEVYSCWGQSESPSLELWNKGMTPGAGAWEAYRRGYRMGMMASSDNHVGMPGRSAPGDRQAHTPFKGGLCAIWAEELTREALFKALKSKRCYGTTGARIIVRFSIAKQPMGSTISTRREKMTAHIAIHGTEELRSVEMVSKQGSVRNLVIERGEGQIDTTFEVPVIPDDFYYVRIQQIDGERAWTSPIFFEVEP